MSRFRDTVAASYRTLPRFRGKSQVGAALGRLMTNRRSDRDCITQVRMRDGSLMHLDVRSRTERWANWTGEYDSEIIRRFTRVFHEGCTVFDVGGNVGFYSVPFARRLKELRGSLHTFEPVPSNYERLQSSIAANRVQAVVAAHPVALGNEEGSIDLHMDNHDNASTGNAVLVKGKVITDDIFTGNATARITKLDTFAQEKGIETCDFIKIDIEGAEVMFLEGGSEFLSRHRPIIYGEFNIYWMQQFGHRFQDVVDVVAPWNYRFFQQDSGPSARFTEITTPGPDAENVLLCPQETAPSVLSALGVRA